MIEIRPLGPDERDRADAVLPLSRLDRPNSGYLVAWDGDAPVGHVCVEWCEPPELQDLWVLPERRGCGIGTALVGAVEERASGRGASAVRLTVGVENRGAARLYRRLGYRRTRRRPQRVKGRIMLRGAPFEVDDTLVEYEKPVDSGGARSS